MKATPHTKTGRVPKTIKTPIDLIRAVNTAVEAGLAADFSDAVERGLRLLLQEGGYPIDLSAEELRERLVKPRPVPGEGLQAGLSQLAIDAATGVKRDLLAGEKITPDPNPAPTPHKVSGDPLVGGKPDQSKKRSGETKLSRGTLVVKDPLIEAVAKKISKPKK